MRDNIEVEGQIKRRRKKFSKPVSDWTANFRGDVAKFLNVGSISVGTLLPKLDQVNL